MSKKTIIKVMIILYVVLMLVLPVGIYIMDYENAPAKWTLGINTENQSLSLTGDPFSLKDVGFNHHPLLVQQNKDGAFVEDIRLARPTHNEIVIVDKEKRINTIVFSILSTTANQAESIYIRSSFGVAFPRFSINNDKQPLTEKNTLDAPYALNGERQLYLELTYKKAAMTEKWSSFLVASSVGAGHVGKAMAWSFSGISRAVSWLGTFAMDHRGQAWQAIKAAAHALVVAGQFLFKVIAYVVVMAFKILVAIFRFIVAFCQDAGWYIGQAWQSGTKGLHYFFVTGPEERRILKVYVLMKAPTERIGVAESVTVNFICVNNQGGAVPSREVRVELKSNIQSDWLLLSPETQATDEKGHFDVRFQTGRSAATYHVNLLVSKQRFHARIDAMPTKPTQILSLKDQLTYVAPIGTLIKDAFWIKVYDRFQNPVPFARVDWYSIIPGVTESVKFLESRTDSKGCLKMDYRMDDMSRSYWVQARLVGTTHRLNYNMQSLAVNPENLVPLGEEDRQVIVGSPLRAPFTVKITDHFENPVPNVLVSFILQDDQQEEVVEKEVRTNRRGTATVRLNTPTKPGEYSLLVSSERMPDSEVGFTIAVQPGSVAKLQRVTGNAQSTFWGKIARKPIRIRTVDSLGNPIAGLPIKWMGDAELMWDEAEPETDDQGYASAKVGANRTKLVVLHPAAEVAGQRVQFDLYPKEPAAFSLYLTSAPVVKVIAAHTLPSDIDMVLRDQYGHALTGKSVGLEYTVIKAGVTYQQNQTHVTSREGRVTFNFVASDEKDEINVKAKYYDGKDTALTWIKVDVIPAGIAKLTIMPATTVATVGQKIDRPIHLTLLDQKGEGVPGVPLDIAPIKAPGKELKDMKSERQKTNRQGKVYFFPVLGKTAGAYQYQVKMGNFDAQFTVNAVADKIDTITIRSPKQRSFVAGSVSRGFMARALDQYGNPVIGSILYYGVADAGAADASMKAKVGRSGYARLVVIMPKHTQAYKLLVTDEDQHVKVVTTVRVHESAVGSVRWLGEGHGLRVLAGSTLKQEFPYQVIDKYGNALTKVKMSMDIYNMGRTATLVGVDGESKTGGEGRFSVTAPKKMGRYWAYIYPSDWADIGHWVTFDVVAAQVDLVQIVTGDNQLIQALNPAPNDFTLLLTDRFGNPVAGQDVNWVYQVKQGSESRYLNAVTHTNKKGVAAFNVVVDKEPGIRELKAYFLRQGRRDKQSFYYKILSNEVGQLQVLSGKNQRVSPGRQLPQAVAVRLVNKVGAPIGDAAVKFVMLSQELSVHTNAAGVASAWLVGPSEKGVYDIKIFAADNPLISATALLTVR